MRSPADNCKFFREASQVARVGAGWLLRIGRNDFEIAIFIKREERVAGAGSGMNAAERGADASCIFDESDAAVKIIAAEQYVV